MIGKSRKVGDTAPSYRHFMYGGVVALWIFEQTSKYSNHCKIFIFEFISRTRKAVSWVSKLTSVSWLLSAAPRRFSARQHLVRHIAERQSRPVCQFVSPGLVGCPPGTGTHKTPGPREGAWTCNVLLWGWVNEGEYNTLHTYCTTAVVWPIQLQYV